MAEAEQTFVENTEEQDFFLQESDQHHLVGDEFDQQNIAASIHSDYDFPVTEDSSLVADEQRFSGNEPDSNFEMISEQTYAENENENEQVLDPEQPDQGLDGIELKQEYAENEENDMDNAPDSSNGDKKQEHENVGGAGGEIKKWPGWPGESVFRMLVPAHKVGNIIGRKGEYIKKIVEETRARIKILDGPPGSQERAVLWAY